MIRTAIIVISSLALRARNAATMPTVEDLVEVFNERYASFDLLMASWD